MDSRAVEQVGLVPAENITGRVSRIYFSADELRDSASIADAFANIRWDRLLTVPR